MSLSEPKLQNPCAKFIEWSGSRGQFEFYDKDVEERVPLETPLYIIVLDQLSSITGFDKNAKSGIYSNEVHDLNRDELVVKMHKGGEIASGLYNDIKGDKRFNYTKSVYACIIKDELELANFKFTGSSIGPWIDSKASDDGCVMILKPNPEVQLNGTTEYYIPIITKSDYRKDIIEKAKGFDRIMQEYFRARGTVEVETSVAPPEATEIGDNHKDDVDDLPF